MWKRGISEAGFNRLVKVSGFAEDDYSLHTLAPVLAAFKERLNALISEAAQNLEKATTEGEEFYRSTGLKMLYEEIEQILNHYSINRDFFED